MKRETVVLCRLLLVLLLVSPVCGRNSFGQALHSEVQRIPVTGNLNSGNILSYIEGETIYFMPMYTDAPERVVFSVGLDGAVKESFTIRQKGKKGLGNERIVSFAVSGTKLIVLSGSSIHFYERSGKHYVVEKSIKNPYSFSGIERLGNSFLLHVCYPFHPLDQKETSVWAKLDLAKQEVVDVHFPEIDNTKFGNLVNSWVSTYEGTIAHASSKEYKIVFYDANYSRVDSIELQSDTLFRVDMGFVEQFDLRSKTGISQFMESDAQKLTRIRKVFLLDDRHLVVLSRLSKEVSPPGGKARLDFWEKDTSGWKIKSQVLGDDMYQEGERYDEQHVFLGNLYQNVFDLRISNGQIYSVSFPYYPKVITESFDRERDMDGVLKDATEYYYGLEKFVFRIN